MFKLLGLIWTFARTLIFGSSGFLKLRPEEQRALLDFAVAASQVHEMSVEFRNFGARLDNFASHINRHERQIEDARRVIADMAGRLGATEAEIAILQRDKR